MVQSNYTEPTNGNFDDLPRGFWPNYKLKKTVNQRKSATQKQDQKDVLKKHRKAR